MLDRYIDTFKNNNSMIFIPYSEDEYILSDNMSKIKYIITKTIYKSFSSIYSIYHYIDELVIKYDPSKVEVCHYHHGYDLDNPYNNYYIEVLFYSSESIKQIIPSKVNNVLCKCIFKYNEYIESYITSISSTMSSSNYCKTHLLQTHPNEQCGQSPH